MQVIGHLGKDAITKDVSGKNVINFTVAHSEKYKDKNGQTVDKTVWVECAYWTDRTAIVPYLLKGTLVYVEGIPEAEAYKNKDGDAKATQRLKVGNVQLLGNKGGGDQQSAPAQSNVGAKIEVPELDSLPF